VGYQTTALFEKDVSKNDLRRLLPEADIFLWEGHHNTLIREWELPDWDEPMAPSLVFLQSCLALMEAKAQPLIQRGAVGVVGTSTRTYSGSGGAISLAFFEALLYEDQSLGSSLRQAKNFLLAYSLLKEKRLGQEAKRRGANQRAAWAFTLWKAIRRCVCRGRRNLRIAFHRSATRCTAIPLPSPCRRRRTTRC
jgi:hypothetical protein